MLAVDHFFLPNNHALPSAPEKSFSSVSSPILAFRIFWHPRLGRRFRLRFITENGCRPLKELVFELFDLVGMHVELLGQFHKGLLVPDGGECHFCLEEPAVVPGRSSRHGLCCSRYLRRIQAESPPILAVQISRANSAFNRRISSDSRSAYFFR